MGNIKSYLMEILKNNFSVRNVTVALFVNFWNVLSIITSKLQTKLKEKAMAK